MEIFSTVTLDIDDGLARLTLNRPEAANTMNMAMGEDLMNAGILLSETQGIRAVLLTGSGKMFCAGGDLKAFSTQGEDLGIFVKRLTSCLHVGMSHLARMSAPLVVAVNGVTAGAGISLCAIGDIVLAAESATFTLAYTAAGLVPDGGSTWLLPRLIGTRRSQELMLLNRRLSAEEAENWGLVTRVIADEVLEAEAEKLAHKLAHGPTQAFGRVKQLLASSFETGFETQMEYESAAMTSVATGRDGREGVSAFLEKRRPDYNGS